MTIVSSQKKVSMWYDKATKPEEWRMQVLWGAWVKKVVFSQKHSDNVDIIGIYSTLWKPKKSDFPFKIDLMAVLAFQVTSNAEVGLIYDLGLDFCDKFGIEHLFKSVQKIRIPNDNLPIRWYGAYAINNIMIENPGDYALYIYINQEYKQEIPLWITTPTLIVYDPEKDTETKIWTDKDNPFEDLE